MTAKSGAPVLAALQANPARFGFDAAIRLVMQASRQGKVAHAVRLRASTALSYPAGSILLFEPEMPHEEGRATLTLGLPGLAGAGGVLPRHYAGVIAEGRGAAFSSVLDLISERMFLGLAEAGIKYRVERAVEAARLDPAGTPSLPEYVLLALAGFAGSRALDRLPHGRGAILHYAGLFAQGPRSANRLAALAADWLSHPVEVVEFVGAWLSIDETEQTCLPHGAFGGAHYQLGVDATAGARVWDPHARVTLRIGPLTLDAFEALLPGQKSLTAFAALVRSYLGLSTALRINLILRTQDIPQARLAAGPSTFARLGWTSWLKRTAEPAGVNADDLAFPV